MLSGRGDWASNSFFGFRQVRAILWVGGNNVFVLQELLLDISWHRYVWCAHILVPFHFYTAIQIAWLIFEEFVLCSYAFHEVVGMLVANIFYAKVIHDKGEWNGTPFVLPQVKSVDAFIIPMGHKPFFVEFVCKDPHMCESQNCSLHAQVHISIVCMVIKIELFSNPNRKDCQQHLHVLKVIGSSS